MSEQEDTIDEFLEQCDFINDDLTIFCYICYKKGDKCIFPNNEEHMVNKVQDICKPHHARDASEHELFVIDE